MVILPSFVIVPYSPLLLIRPKTPPTIISPVVLAEILISPLFVKFSLLQVLSPTCTIPPISAILEIGFSELNVRVPSLVQLTIESTPEPA